MGRKNDGIISEVLDALFALSRAVPAAGFVGAALLVGAGAYLRWINPKGLYGAAPLMAVLCWALSVMVAGTAVMGLLARRERRQRLDAQETLADLTGMSWLQFEQLVADAFRRHGFRVQEMGGPQPDGGVDLVLRDGGGAEHLVQCKHYRVRMVSLPRVREFYGSMAAHGTRCEGAVVTCGQFTQEAKAFAEGKPLRLIDGESLLRMIRDTNPIAPAVSTYIDGPRAKPLPPAQAGRRPACPACGVAMVRRIASRGKNAGKPFWGCANFPGCRRIIEIAAQR